MNIFIYKPICLCWEAGRWARWNFSVVSQNLIFLCCKTCSLNLRSFSSFCFCLSSKALYLTRKIRWYLCFLITFAIISATCLLSGGVWTKACPWIKCYKPQHNWIIIVNMNLNGTVGDKEMHYNTFIFLASARDVMISYMELTCRLIQLIADVTFTTFLTLPHKCVTVGKHTGWWTSTTVCL